MGEDIRLKPNFLFLWLVDYACGIGLFFLLSSTMTEQETVEPPLAIALITTLVILVYAREAVLLKRYAFSKYQKLDMPHINFSLLIYTIVYYCIFAYGDWFVLTTSWKSALEIWVQAHFISFFQLSALDSIHFTSHLYPPAYPSHKHHHTVRRDCTAFKAHHLEPIDAFATLWGFPMAFCLWQYFFQTKLHVFSFLLVLCQDLLVHSCNPHSPYLFNPILDQLMKPTLSHNLHHSETHSNISHIPYHHLFPSYLKQDIAKYERRFEIKIPFWSSDSQEIEKQQ